MIWRISRLTQARPRRHSTRGLLNVGVVVQDRPQPALDIAQVHAFAAMVVLHLVAVDFPTANTWHQGGPK